MGVLLSLQEKSGHSSTFFQGRYANNTYPHPFGANENSCVLLPDNQEAKEKSTAHFLTILCPIFLVSGCRSWGGLWRFPASLNSFYDNLTCCLVEVLQEGVSQCFEKIAYRLLVGPDTDDNFSSCTFFHILPPVWGFNGLEIVNPSAAQGHTRANKSANPSVLMT